MKQGGIPASYSSDNPRISGSDDTTETVPQVVMDVPDGLSLNFHSPEFNQTDDLNDNSGNYRTFQPLDGIITADMRHQMERRKHQSSGNACADDAPASRALKEQKPNDLKNVEEAVVAPPPLTLISRGRVLIVDTDAVRAIACGRRLHEQGLLCTLVVVVPPPSPVSARSGQTMPVYVDKISIAGAFGEFSVTATKEGKEKLLADWLDNRAAAFDLVLDLQSAPSYAGDRLPAGYYLAGENLEEALTKMPEMRGRFAKPVFTAMRKDRCLHGRSRKHACDLCLEICPVHAIQRIDGDVVINPYLCQGCGGCSLVCPADAIVRLEPSPESLLRRMQAALGNRLMNNSGGPVNVLISDMKEDATSQPAGTRADASWLRVDVDEIGHAGLELFLGAFAYGADNVLVACNPENPPRIIKAVTSQIDMAQAILRGLDLPVDKIRFTQTLPPADRGGKENEKADASESEKASGDLFFLPLKSATGDKRMLIRELTGYLHERSDMKKPWFPLPEGSPFGSVVVDAGSCTCCMACAVVCPTHALVAGGDAPTLTFHESRCHQCGFCEATCPEGAIKRQPGMSCPPDVAHGKTALMEAEPFQCLVCGSPFATRTMVGRMQEKLRNHWMYDKETQLRRLGMCRTCRTRDALMSKDMTAWNQR